MNLLNNIPHYLIMALLIAITAVMYSYVLIQPGEIFAKLFLKLDIFFNSDKRTCQGKGPHPIFKMIMRCEKCVAGQMALWIYFIYGWPLYFEGHFILIVPHILFIGLTIFLTLVIKKFYIKHIE